MSCVAYVNVQARYNVTVTQPYTNDWKLLFVYTFTKTILLWKKDGNNLDAVYAFCEFSIDLSSKMLPTVRYGYREIG